MLLLLFFNATAFALEDDKNQPLYLQADTVSIDKKTGESQYIGNVSVTQGSMHLIAAKATVYTNADNQVKEAIAEGDQHVQAHYTVLNDEKKPPLNAYADIIHVYPEKHIVYLIGHAKVIQGEDTYEAPEIEYNSEKQQVFSKKSPQGKTVIVIHPQSSSTVK